MEYISELIERQHILMRRKSEVLEQLDALDSALDLLSRQIKEIVILDEL